VISRHAAKTQKEDEEIVAFFATPREMMPRSRRGSLSQTPIKEGGCNHDPSDLAPRRQDAKKISAVFCFA
jgi:hypothetical protein